MWPRVTACDVRECGYVAGSDSSDKCCPFMPASMYTCVQPTCSSPVHMFTLMIEGEARYLICACFETAC